MNSFLDEQREGLASLLAEAGCDSVVPVRRAVNENYLLALPLPMRQTPEVCSRFRRMAELKGWRITEQNNWILLGREFPSPAARDIHPEGECAAVCSLLLRHPSGEKSVTLTNLLLKAADENMDALETACAKIHSVLSSLLREGKELPDLYGFLNDAIWRYEVC